MIVTKQTSQSIHLDEKKFQVSGSKINGVAAGSSKCAVPILIGLIFFRRNCLSQIFRVISYFRYLYWQFREFQVPTSCA